MALPSDGYITRHEIHELDEIQYKRDGNPIKHDFRTVDMTVLKILKSEDDDLTLSCFNGCTMAMYLSIVSAAIDHELTYELVIRMYSSMTHSS